MREAATVKGMLIVEESSFPQSAPVNSHSKRDLFLLIFHFLYSFFEPNVLSLKGDFSVLRLYVKVAK